MLKQVRGKECAEKSVSVEIGKASFPAPFYEGLEYSPPARGTWNIVHTGMLIPESHQIFVCAQGCLRGVVLTAAEMGAMGRYSSILIREENVLDGTMEQLMVDGVADILHKLSYRPRAILLFISCQHFFLAYDQQFVFQTLRERFPDIRFVDCYMIPTLRKSGLTPDQKMRVQLFRLLEPLERDPRRVNLLGSNLPVSPGCELLEILRENGYQATQLQDCETFEEYLDLARAAGNIVYEPMAVPAAKDLEERLGQKYLYLRFSYREEEIRKNYEKLAEWLGIAVPNMEQQREHAREALRHAREKIGDTPIVVDYTFTFQILSFVRMLTEEGFRVTECIADAFSAEEEADYQWLKKHAPELMITSGRHPELRRVRAEKMQENETQEGGSRARFVLAIGQKAAYHAGTDYFVNVAESGGYFGYDGIVQIAALMEEAFEQPKDTREVIQRKGIGCESCVLSFADE